MSSALLKGADLASSQMNTDNSHPHPAGEPWVAFGTSPWRPILVLKAQRFFLFLLLVVVGCFFRFPKNIRFQVKAAFATSLLIGSVCLFELMRAGVGEGKGTSP